MTEDEKEKLKEIFRSSKGIVDHEFSQEVIDACRADVEARQQRILNGETTFEQEDAALMAEWKKLNSNNQKKSVSPYEIVFSS